MDKQYLLCSFQGSYKQYAYVNSTGTQAKKLDYVVVFGGTEPAIVQVRSTELTAEQKAMAFSHVIHVLTKAELEVAAQRTKEDRDG